MYLFIYYVLRVWDEAPFSCRCTNPAFGSESLNASCECKLVQTADFFTVDLTLQGSWFAEISSLNSGRSDPSRSHMIKVFILAGQRGSSSSRF